MKKPRYDKSPPFWVWLVSFVWSGGFMAGAALCESHQLSTVIFVLAWTAVLFVFLLFGVLIEDKDKKTDKTSSI